MATSDRFNILVVDPDSGSRGKLKQVALALTTFNKVFVASTLEEALSKTEGGDAFDVLTLSYRYKTAEITDFISAARKTKRGEQWAYIAVMKATDQKNENMAESVIGGIDGFLFEPFSADNLREMAEITAKVKLQNETNRKKTAMLMVLQDVAQHLDAVASFRAQGKDPVIAQRKLKEACERLEKVTKDARKIYVDVAMNFFQNAVPPVINRYTGVSKRVRERMAARAAKELEGRYKE